MLTFWKSIRDRIKANAKVYSFYRHLFDRDYIYQRKRMNKTKVKSMRQIREEMKQYSLYWREPADDYIRYKLFEFNISMEAILDFIPAHYFYCKYLSQRYKDVSCKKLDDKLEQYHLFCKLGIPHPQFLGIIKNRKFYSDGSDCEMSNMLSTLDDGEKLFVKPLMGAGGVGIKVLHIKSGAFWCHDKEITRIEDLQLSKDIAYIVQRGIKQIPEIAQINSSSVNTLRVITQYGKESPVVACIMRIGRNGREVDNSNLGGLSVQVNFDTGEFIGPAISEHGGDILYKHPDSHYSFVGNGIPNWIKYKAEILNIINKLCFLNDVGWDIAISNDGCLAIEFNLNYGIDHLQCTCGGMRRLMSIYPNKQD